MHVCVFSNLASADGLLSLYSLSLPYPLLCPPPLLSSLPLSRARALNEAGGQRQCAANWPSLPGAPAACNWSVQWGPTVQPPLHPALFHSNSQDAHCPPVCLSLVSSTRGHSIFTYTSNTLSSLSFFLYYSHATKSTQTFFWIACPTCHSMFLLINIYLLCLVSLSFYLSPLSLSVFFFFFARLSFPHLVPAFSHFPWLVPPSHSFSSLATVGFRQLLRSPIGQQPGKKQLPAPISLTMGPTVPALAKLHHTVLS